MSTVITPPRKNVMIGVTHTREGLPIIHESKVLKVGIGLPRGKAVDLFVNSDGLWCIRQGKAVSGKLEFKTVAQVKTRAEAEMAFRKAFDEADLCAYPRKIPYFTFLRPVMGRDGTEIYVPDFEATETYSFVDQKHPGAPTEIDIIFFDDSPFSGSFSMWSTSELRCTGDGENAARSVAMYDDEKKVPEEFRPAWKAARDAGQRTFGIASACWSCGCPFSKEKDGKPSACKPSGDLKFQLSRSIRVGSGTAFFHTSGYRSIIQLFSAVERIKELTGGRIAGIPLKMVLRSHRTNHAGISAVQQNVSIEFRASDMKSIREGLIEQAWKFRQAAGLLGAPAAVHMIEAGDPEPEESPMSAQAMTNEFYIDNDEVDSAPTATTNSPATQAASAAKVQEIGERLSAAAPAPASNVVSISPDKAPWADHEKPRVRMTELYQVMLKDLGKPEYDRLIAKHGLSGGLMKYDSTEALACYREMEMVARGPKQATAPPATTDGERPLF